METAECKHATTIKSLTHGQDVEECGVCHQQILRSTDKYRRIPPAVLRLGRIGNKVVLPDPTHKLQLGKIDREDLAAVVVTAPEETRERTEKVPQKQLVPSKRPEDPKARAAWYGFHKKEMIDDLIALGKGGFMQKWGEFGIKSRMISHLKTEPYYKDQVKKAAPGAPSSPSAVPQFPKGERESAGLPPLPPWNDTWTPEVQTRWLEAYKIMLTQGGNTSGTR